MKKTKLLITNISFGVGYTVARKAFELGMQVYATAYSLNMPFGSCLWIKKYLYQDKPSETVNCSDSLSKNELIY